MMDNRTIYADPVTMILSAGELAERLNTGMDCNVNDLRSALLVLLSYSIYMSYEEIYSLHPMKSHVRMELAKLISKGYVIKKDFGQAVGTCSIFFAITKSGFEEARRRCLGYIPVRYKYARKSAAYIHTYYAGYNLFQMLRLPFRFSWEREYLGDSYDYKKDFKKRLLQVDALCTINPNTSDSSKYYIEEDTGSESFSILLGKMENYSKLAYITPHNINDMIIFSCVDDSAGYRHSRSDGPSPFNEKKVLSLIKYMDNGGYNDAFDILYDPDSDYPDKDFIRVLLETTGIILNTGDGIERISDRHADRDFLNEYRHGLLHLRNPFLSSHINSYHISVSKRRMNSLAVESVKGYLSYNWVYSMSKGYRVLCLPTTLFADRLSYTLLSSFPDKMYELKRFLSGYFNSPVYESEISEDIPISSDITLGRYRSFRLRNQFSYYDEHGSKQRLYVEMPFVDIGAWIRCFLFSRYYASEEPVNIVCIFEDSYQAGIFYRLLGYTYTSLGIDHSKCGIFGADLADIKGDGSSQLYVMDDFSDYREKRTFLSLF